MIDFLAARVAELYMVVTGYLPAARLSWGLLILPLGIAAGIVWFRWTQRRRVEQAFGRGFMLGTAEAQVQQEVGATRWGAFFAGVALIVILIVVGLAVFVL